MKNKTLKNKRFLDLYKYIFSYIMAASLPLIVVIIIFGTVFTQAYQREVEASQSSSLLSAQNSVELMLSQMESIVQTIQMEEEYSYNLDDQLKETIELQKRLKQYQISSAFLKDILFYTHGNTSICAASSTYSLDTYANSVNQMTGISSETFTKYLNETESAIILPPHEEIMMGSMGRKVVDFIYPLPYLSSSSYATVLFKIEAETLQKAFHTENYANYAAVLPSGGEKVILAGSDTYKKELEILLKKEKFESTQGSFICNLESQEYMVSYLRNQEKDILYLYLLPTSSALKPVYQIQWTLYGVLASMLLIECLLVFLVAYKNYRPIRSLENFLFKHYPEPPIDFPAEGSAIENAEHLLNHMAVVHKSLNEKLAVNRDTLREAVLYKAIHGGFSSLEELNTTYENSGILITNPYLRILMIQFSQGHDGKTPQPTDLLEILRSCLVNQQIYHCFFSGKNVFLIADSSEKRTAYQEALPKIHQLLKQKNPNLDVYMGISSSFSDVSKLHMAYIESVSALDTAVEKNIPNVPVFYGQIISHKEIEQLYPYGEINQLGLAIQENNKEKFQGLVSQIYTLLKAHQYNIILGKFVCYDVVSAILKATLQTGKGFSVINERAPDIMGLSSSHSMDELLSILEDITQKTMEYLDEKEQPNNNLMEQIISFIHSNVFDYNFSVGQLADQFGISQNNLSQRFKRYLNQTPTEYINRLKMEKAKSFLSNTDMPLRIIVEKLGYSNESSFIRKFKDATGMTPGEYRRQTRNSL